MNKLLLAIVPVCVTFGPLFMTRIAGTTPPDAGNGLVTAGVLMLIAGLVVMFRIVVAQQKVIEKLQSEQRVGG